MMVGCFFGVDHSIRLLDNLDEIMRFYQQFVLENAEHSDSIMGFLFCTNDVDWKSKMVARVQILKITFLSSRNPLDRYSIIQQCIM
jgi:hypothetical protein